MERHPAASAGWISRSRTSAKQTLREYILLAGVAAVVLVGAGAGEAHLYLASERARAESVVQDGMRLMSEGDYGGAEERLTRAIDIAPVADGYLQRGLTRKGLNQVDAAIEDFERALSLDPNLASAHTALGVTYREQDDPQRAINEFTLAIQLRAGADALYQRGQVYELLGQHQQAIQDYSAAIHEQPDAPYIYRARAVSREAIGDRAGAEQDRRTLSQMGRR